MTSYERVYARLEGKPVDRVPNLNILMQFAAKYIGVPYGKYCTDYRCLVEGNIKCCRDFSIDMVSAISDPFRETSGFGADVIIPYDDVPLCKDYLLKGYGDVKKLKTVNPYEAERMYDRIKAVELYKQSVAGEFPILGWCEGPIAEASDLRGINQICLDLIDEPEFVEELMDICVENAIAFASEQIKAGADFMGVGDAAASLIGPRVYEEYVLPREKKLFDAIHSMGARVKLHICGNITPMLDLLPLTGADIIDIDWMVDFEEAIRKFGGRASVCGNFDPVKILLQGNQEDVWRSVKDCLDVSDDRTFISAGCEVPKFTSPENLKAVYEALKHYGGRF